ncbi:MAG: hypothetical protein ACE5Z5_00245 [Candidatus Bathyarchaeia archaeon]
MRRSSLYGLWLSIGLVALALTLSWEYPPYGEYFGVYHLLVMILLVILIFFRERLPKLGPESLVVIGFVLLLGETILIIVANYSDHPMTIFLRALTPYLAVVGTLLQTPHVIRLVLPRRDTTDKKKVLELIAEKDELLRRVEEIDLELGFRTRKKNYTSQTT